MESMDWYYGWGQSRHHPVVMLINASASHGYKLHATPIHEISEGFAARVYLSRYDIYYDKHTAVKIPPSLFEQFSNLDNDASQSSHDVLFHRQIRWTCKNNVMRSLSQQLPGKFSMINRSRRIISCGVILEKADGSEETFDSCNKRLLIKSESDGIDIQW